MKTERKKEKKKKKKKQEEAQKEGERNFSRPLQKKKKKKRLDQIVSTKCVVARSQEHCAWNFFLDQCMDDGILFIFFGLPTRWRVSVPPAKGEGISFRLTNHTGNVIFEMAAASVIYPFIQSLIAHLNYSDKIWSVLQALLTPSELGNENSIITR